MVLRKIRACPAPSPFSMDEQHTSLRNAAPTLRVRCTNTHTRHTRLMINGPDMSMTLTIRWRLYTNTHSLVLYIFSSPPDCVGHTVAALYLSLSVRRCTRGNVFVSSRTTTMTTTSGDSGGGGKMIPSRAISDAVMLLDNISSVRRRPQPTTNRSILSALFKMRRKLPDRLAAGIIKHGRLQSTKMGDERREFSGSRNIHAHIAPGSLR